MRLNAKVLHLFWGRSRPLSWLRLQTVRTFAALNPDWKIKVWYRDREPVAPFWPTREQSEPYTGRDYFGGLAEIHGVMVRPVAIDLALPDVPFSDYLRWHLLATEGGFWSDFDIAYMRPMNEIGGHAGALLITYPCGVWPIGFLGALDDDGRRFFEQVRILAHARIKRATSYQDLGCVVLDRVARAHGITPSRRQWVYPEYLSNRVRAFFSARKPYTFPQDCIGAHWFAGADFASRFENSLDPERLTDEQRRTPIIRAIEAV